MKNTNRKEWAYIVVKNKEACKYISTNISYRYVQSLARSNVERGSIPVAQSQQLYLRSTHAASCFLNFQK
jgi:hypothetical protein